jgi:hypothetical protein
MKELKTRVVKLLDNCLFSFLLIVGVVFFNSMAVASETVRSCKILFAKDYALPRLAGTEDQLVSEIFKHPLKTQSDVPMSLRMQTETRGDFLVLNLNELQKQAPESLEWALAKEYMQVFIPNLYRQRLKLPEEALNKIKNTFNDPDFIKRTTLIINVSSAENALPVIRAGMGIITAQPGTEKLPLQHDLEVLAPEFSLSPLEVPGTKWAEVIRTGIDPQLRDVNLFGILVKITKAVLLQDPKISQYYFHTTEDHLINYRRKLRSLTPVIYFKGALVPEVVAVVEREATLKEFKP